MRIHADRSDNYVECVLSDKAWDRIRVGRDVIDRAIASGKVHLLNIVLQSWPCHYRLAIRSFTASIRVLAAFKTCRCALIS
jgi:hypothetical protein